METRMKFLLLAGLLTGATFASAVEAQGRVGRWTVDSGTIVRLHLQTGGREVGRLTARLEPGTARIRYCRYPAPPCRPGDPTAVGREAREVVGLDVQRGTQAGRGALVGAGAGLGLLALGAAVARGVGGDGRSQMSPGVRLFAVATVIAVPAVIGFLAGSERPQWEQAR